VENDKMGEPHFPNKIRQLQTYAGAFDARQLQADNCEVLFASYPAGMQIEPHQHNTENHGVVRRFTLMPMIQGLDR
jgi:hypothetical protein